MIWHDLIAVQIPLWEKVFRTFAVYAGILVLLRLAGKRDLAQITTFDLVVILLLSNVVQNAIIGPDNSVLGGLFGAALLIGVNAVVVRLTTRSERAVRIFEGSPTVLVRDGKYDDTALSREGLTRSEVDAAVRRQGADTTERIETAELTPGGTMVVNLKPEAQTATKSDIAALRQQLDALQGQLTALLARGAT